MSNQKATLVTRAFPTFRKLWDKYRDLEESGSDGCMLLQVARGSLCPCSFIPSCDPATLSLQNDQNCREDLGQEVRTQRLGPALSRKVHYAFFACKDPQATVEDKLN